MNKADVGLGFIVATPWGLNFIAIELGIEGVPRFSVHLWWSDLTDLACCR